MYLARTRSVVAAVSVSALVIACGGSTEGPKVGPPAVISAVNGAIAPVAAGATTPIPLTVQVADAGGMKVTGAQVNWTTASGTITPGNGSTDPNGQSTAQWTPGTTAGAQTATASVTGAGSASFTVTVTPAALATLKLNVDTVRLLSILTQVTTIGINGADAFGNAISNLATTVTSDNPSVATVAYAGNAAMAVTAVDTGTTHVRASQGTATASATVIVTNPCSGVTKMLAVGESQTFAGAQANQLCIDGLSGSEYVAVPFYATGWGGTGSGQSAYTAAPVLQVTLTPLAIGLLSPLPTVGPAAAAARTSVSTTGNFGLVRDAAWEAKFRQGVRTKFGPLIAKARATRWPRPALRKGTGVSSAVDANHLSLNVNVKESCANPQFVSATVKAVSAHAIVAEDDRNPAGGLSADDYQAIANQFDTQIWPVDSTNFGAPTDVDSSGHVILFFTRAVNELTPATNTTSFIGGFFFGRDLYPPGTDCGGGLKVVGSNFAEMFYLLAPDPTGQINQHVRTTSFVRSITAGTVAHEFQHLINFGRHLWINPVLFSAFEETFLDEGLAHVAEELNYYAATGRRPRTNIDSSALVTPAEQYLAFGRQNALRFGEYLKNPDKYPPYAVIADTSLAVRGGIWSLLRYSTDRRSSSVPDAQTWFSLVNPTSDVQGLNNLKAVFGAGFLSQMRDWAIANYFDDASLTSGVADYQHPSWNTRSVESYMNNGYYPLKMTDFGARTVLTLADGGAAYLRFAVPAGKIGGAIITSGAALPSTFSVTVIRTK